MVEYNMIASLEIDKTFADDIAAIKASFDAIITK